MLSRRQLQGFVVRRRLDQRGLILCTHPPSVIDWRYLFAVQDESALPALLTVGQLDMILRDEQFAVSASD